MQLAIDIGNTSVHFGVFQEGELRATWLLGADRERFPDEYAILVLSLLRTASIHPADIRECVMVSTVPVLTQTFTELVKRYFKTTPLVVGSGVRTGMRILYDNPRDVGADRVTDAVAALRLYGAPLIVVDCGTAMVFDAISKDGDYLGGAIAPGLGIAAEALFQRASKLYRVDMETPKSAIGKNPVHSMQSGIMLGYVGLVEGIVERFQRELGGGARVIGTGGYAPIIAKETPALEVVNPNLTLIGLHMIYEMNRA